MKDTHAKSHFTHHHLDGPQEAPAEQDDVSEAPGAANPRKKTEKEIEAKLAEIYENGDGSLPDMTQFSRRERNRFFTAFVVLLVSCLTLALVAWLGFFVFQPKGKFVEEDVILSVSGKEAVGFGEEVTYRVRYRNAQNVPLGSAVVSVRYPKGFIFSGSSRPPTSDTNDEWAVGSIEPQGSGYIDIRGRLFGDERAEQSLRVFLNYKPANFSSEFQKVAFVSARVSEVPVSVSYNVPEEVTAGADAEMSLVLRPAAEYAGAVRVDIDPGVNFAKKDSTPKSDEFERYQWSFDRISAEETITLRGAFQAGGEPRKVVLTVYGSGDGASEEYVLSRREFEVSVRENDVSAQVAINGSTGELSVQPGDMLITSVSVRNTGRTALRNARVRLVFDAPSLGRQSLLHWSRVEDELEADIVGEQLNDDVRRGIISWTAAHLPALARIDPGDDVAVDFQLPLKNGELIELADFKLSQIFASVELQYEADGERRVVSGNKMNITVNSDLSFEVRDEAAAEGGGDRHTVVWLVSNNFHPLKDITLEADIYGDVAWDADALSVPAGTAEFDAESGRLRWTLPSMPSALNTLALQFGVVLNEKNPTQTNLTSKVRIQATDEITGQKIILVGDEVLLKSG